MEDKQVDAPFNATADDYRRALLAIRDDRRYAGRWKAWVRLKEARLDQGIICRGCKTSIQLRDYMGTVKRGERGIRRAFKRFEDALQGRNTTINISF